MCLIVGKFVYLYVKIDYFKVKTDSLMVVRF